MSLDKPALQMYSVRDHMDRDPEGTLKKLREIGYQHVELAGTAGMSANAFKDVLDELGMTAISTHHSFNHVVNNVDAVISDARLFGMEYVVIPWHGANSADGWADAGKQMNQAGEVLREARIHLCYHNHAHEFDLFDGKTAFDIIFDNAEPEHLGLELDTAWAAVAGKDVAELITRFTNRIPLIHLKDYKVVDDANVLTELGNGVIDWSIVLEAAKNAGVVWHIAELDQSETDSLESAAINYNYMRDRA